MLTLIDTQFDRGFACLFLVIKDVHLLILIFIVHEDLWAVEGCSRGKSMAGEEIRDITEAPNDRIT